MDFIHIHFKIIHYNRRQQYDVQLTMKCTFRYGKCNETRPAACAKNQVKIIENHELNKKKPGNEVKESFID